MRKGGGDGCWEIACLLNLIKIRSFVPLKYIATQVVMYLSGTKDLILIRLHVYSRYKRLETYKWS